MLSDLTERQIDQYVACVDYINQKLCEGVFEFTLNSDDDPVVVNEVIDLFNNASWVCGYADASHWNIKVISKLPKMSVVLPKGLRTT